MKLTLLFSTALLAYLVEAAPTGDIEVSLHTCLILSSFPYDSYLEARMRKADSDVVGYANGSNSYWVRSKVRFLPSSRPLIQPRSFALTSYQVEEPNPDIIGFANGPNSKWVHSKVWDVGCLRHILAHSRFCVRSRNPIPTSLDSPTALIQNGFAARYGTFVVFDMYSLIHVLCQVEQPSPDVKGYANGPDSYWVRSKVRYPRCPRLVL
jgi:hypothetical protein